MTIEHKAIPYVIASGDEGLQLNCGIRFGFAGSGYELPYFAQALDILKQLTDNHLVLVSLQEDDWMSEKLQTKNPNLYQETLEKFAIEHQLKYVGQIDYGDPRDLSDGITRGHIVRPQKIHVADQICFTTGGGEQVYNLRQFIISADYLHALKLSAAQELIKSQIDFYQQLAGRPLDFVRQTEGNLPAEISLKNQKILDQILP